MNESFHSNLPVNRSFLARILPLFIWPAAFGCSPKIYVIDRQTVFETEAAGRWPEFEKELLARGKAAGPTPFTAVPADERRAKLLNVLNGQQLGQQLDVTPKKEN